MVVIRVPSTVIVPTDGPSEEAEAIMVVIWCWFTVAVVRCGPSDGEIVIVVDEVGIRVAVPGAGHDDGTGTGDDGGASVVVVRVTVPLLGHHDPERTEGVMVTVPSLGHDDGGRTPVVSVVDSTLLYALIRTLNDRNTALGLSTLQKDSTWGKHSDPLSYPGMYRSETRQCLLDRLRLVVNGRHTPLRRVD